MEEHFPLGKSSENLKDVTMLKRAAVIHVVENSRVEEAEVEEKNEEEINRPGSEWSLCVCCHCVVPWRCSTRFRPEGRFHPES